MRILRGDVLIQTRQLDTALAAMQSLVLPKRLETSALPIRRLATLASAQAAKRQFDEAKKSVAAAESLARRHHPELRGDLLTRKASILNAAGSYHAMLTASRQLIDVAERTRNQKLLAQGWAYDAQALGNLDRAAEALDANLRAAKYAETAHADALALFVRLNTGWLYYLSGDLDRAKAICLQLDKELETSGDLTRRAKNLQILGAIELARPDLAEALRYFQQVIKLAAPDSKDQAEAYANAAQTEIRLEHFDQAVQDNAQALAIKRKLNESEAEMRSLLIEGEIAEKRGQLDEADALYSRVSDEAKSPTLRWSADAYRGSLYGSRNEIEKAVAAFERALAVVDAGRAEAKSLDAKLAYTSRVADLFDDYSRVLVNADRGAEALRIAELARARTLADALNVKPPEVTFDARKRVAAANVVALEYAFGTKGSYLWAITPKRVATFELPPRAEVQKAIADYAAALANPRGTLQTTRRAGERLFNMLVGPAASLIPAHARVAIVPDGPLNSFNLETLVVPGPTPHYWIADVTIELLPSLQVLGRTPTTSNGDAMLLVGNAPQADPHFPPLTHAGEEIELVKRNYPAAKVLSGPGATPNAYVAARPQQYALIHFVAHGEAVKTSPLDSSVVLARDRDGYKLYAREIIQHPLGARLVTISSCASAGQRAFEGEGLIGVAWAFLHAGAQQVVAALWNVNDVVTPQLMASMYGSMRGGSDAPSALRDAKLRLIAAAGPHSRAYYWAPFVVYSGR